MIDWGPEPEYDEDFERQRAYLRKVREDNAAHEWHRFTEPMIRDSVVKLKEVRKIFDELDKDRDALGFGIHHLWDSNSTITSFTLLGYFARMINHLVKGIVEGYTDHEKAEFDRAGAHGNYVDIALRSIPQGIHDLAYQRARVKTAAAAFSAFQHDVLYALHESGHVELLEEILANFRRQQEPRATSILECAVKEGPETTSLRIVT